MREQAEKERPDALTCLFPWDKITLYDYDKRAVNTGGL